MRAVVVSLSALFLFPACQNGGSNTQGAAADATGSKTILTEEPATLSLGKKSLKGTWRFFPNANAKAWVFLQHGFQRQEKNMKAVAEALAQKGFLVASFSFGNGDLKDPTTIENLLQMLEENGVHPASVSVPEKYILMGHSLGGNFVSRVAAKAAERPTSRLLGAILLDPVELDDHMAKAFQTLKGRVPTMSILGEPGACNANSNVRKSITAAGFSFPGIHLTSGSHCDAEGASTDWMCTILCGSSRKNNLPNLQEFASNWAAGLAGEGLPAAYLPGGTRYEELVAAGEIKGL